MTDQNAAPTVPAQDELKVLKARADVMGLSYRSSISLKALKAKVNGALKDDVPDTKDDNISDNVVPFKETSHQLKIRQRLEAGKLIRVRITCMNPAKRDWPGEIFTVSNSVVGTYKKYVPFNNDEGWHVPKIILNMIQERKCQIFVTVTGPRGITKSVSKLITEFAIDIMTPLTTEEILDLARKQAMSGSIDN